MRTWSVPRKSNGLGRPSRTGKERVRILSAEPLNAETPLAALEESLTPESQFFVRSHFRRPDLAPRKHFLEVVGAVEQPLRLNMADLEAMGTRTLAVTVECAGNGRTGLQPLPAGEPWVLGGVSTARWTGVPLRAVLESARLRPRVVEVLAIGADRGRQPADLDSHDPRPLCYRLSPGRGRGAPGPSGRTRQGVVRRGRGCESPDRGGRCRAVPGRDALASYIAACVARVGVRMGRDEPGPTRLAILCDGRERQSAARRGPMESIRLREQCRAGHCHHRAVTARKPKADA